MRGGSEYCGARVGVQVCNVCVCVYMYMFDC